MKNCTANLLNRQQRTFHIVSVSPWPLLTFLVVLALTIALTTSVAVNGGCSVQVLADSVCNVALKPLEAFTAKQNLQLINWLKEYQLMTKSATLHLVGIVDAVLNSWHMRSCAKLLDLLPAFEKAAKCCYSNGTFDVGKGFFHLIYDISLDPSLATSDKLSIIDLKRAFESYCSMYKSYLDLIDALNSRTLTVDLFYKYAKAAYSLEWFADPDVRPVVPRGATVHMKGDLGAYLKSTGK